MGCGSSTKQASQIKVFSAVFRSQSKHGLVTIGLKVELKTCIGKPMGFRWLTDIIVTLELQHRFCSKIILGLFGEIDD